MSKHTKKLIKWAEDNPNVVKLALLVFIGFLIGLLLGGCAKLRESVKTADAVFEVIEEKKKEKSGERVEVIRVPQRRYRTCNRVVTKGSLWWKREEVESSVQNLYPRESCKWN